MNYCVKCGAPLNPDARFCGECGTPVSSTATVETNNQTYSQPTNNVSDNTGINNTEQHDNHYYNQTQEQTDNFYSNQTHTQPNQNTQNPQFYNPYMQPDNTQAGSTSQMNWQQYPVKKGPSVVAHIFAILLTILLIPVTFATYSGGSVAALITAPGIKELIKVVDIESILKDSAHNEVEKELAKKDFFIDFINEKATSYIHAAINNKKNIHIFKEGELVELVDDHRDEIEKSIGQRITDQDMAELADAEKEIIEKTDDEFHDAYKELKEAFDIFKTAQIIVFVLAVIYVLLMLFIFIAYHRRIRNAFICLAVPHFLTGLPLLVIGLCKTLIIDVGNFNQNEELAVAWLLAFVPIFGAIALGIAVFDTVLAVILSSKKSK
ncbi:MAG: zinc ribbon domain-containing protein [Lachnospiraceae bacterium]|nr:zinc ribbon domain-containing protein [Lachnospiraceae bacterium]